MKCAICSADHAKVHLRNAGFLICQTCYKSLETNVGAAFAGDKDQSRTWLRTMIDYSKHFSDAGRLQNLRQAIEGNVNILAFDLIK
jgi:hypothetical protein